MDPNIDDQIIDAAGRMQADIFILDSAITRELATELMEFHSTTRARKQCILVVMNTIGGNPHAAYIMSNHLRQCYPNTFTALVCGPCRSAGTLLVLGAQSIVIGRRGELGPLDMQVQKKDERFDRESGLDMLSALDILTNMAITTFNNHVSNVEIGTLVSTRLAAEMTTKLVATVVSPIASRLDPIGLGRRQRALEVARAYGRRLGVRAEPLDLLVRSYPDHGFVITFEEAKALLGNIVRQPNEEELYMETVLRMKPTEGIVFLNPQADAKEMRNAEDERGRDSNQREANGQRRGDSATAT